MPEMQPNHYLNPHEVVREGGFSIGSSVPSRLFAILRRPNIVVGYYLDRSGEYRIATYLPNVERHEEMTAVGHCPLEFFVTTVEFANLNGCRIEN